MTKPLNCWEFKSCGRGPGGTAVDKLGPCPAAGDVRVDGVNRRLNGGFASELSAQWRLLVAAGAVRRYAG